MEKYFDCNSHSERITQLNPQKLYFYRQLLGIHISTAMDIFV